MKNQELLNNIQEAAKHMRKKAIQMTYDMGNTGAHIGGGLSLIEIMAVLYLGVLNYDKNNLKSEDRDRLIFSKGHGTLGLYTAMERAGILTETDLQTYKKNESKLSAHPSMNADLGIEFSSGSLGQGLSLGVGSCIGLQRKGNTKSKVYVILGDGECDEGSVWEAAMSAAHYNLSNLVVIVDKNQLQYDGNTEDILAFGSMEKKWESFGWDVAVVDGHNVEELYDALNQNSTKPLVVIAQTVKGKGVSFMEGNPLWHNGRLTDAQYNQAMQEVE